MDTTIQKFNSYNFLTKYLFFTCLFGLFSLDFLFFWSIIWLGMTASYHLYKAFIDHKVVTETSPLLCQKEFETGKNEFNFLFFIAALICIFQAEIFYLVCLGLFFLAKSIFINNSNIVIKNYNINT